ncbi:unnamed protein product [Amoebophrya sp. A120]|nr:unnamed protein product [Amoebophrya sp. A120]|eukprot:GSA120T00023895001.1
MLGPASQTSRLMLNVHDKSQNLPDIQGYLHFIASVQLRCRVHVSDPGHPAL